MDDHGTAVQFMRAWHEWRPDCSCGWVGSYHQTPESAENEAREHRRASAPDAL